VRVTLKSGVAGVRPGDTAERIIARARNSMVSLGRARAARR
jgi:hypothetical protein